MHINMEEMKVQNHTRKKSKRKRSFKKINDNMKRPNFKNYMEHLQKVKNAVAKVDNKPPKFNVDVYFKPRRLEADARRIVELDKENMNLLKSLNTITRMGGVVNCWQRKIVHKTKIVTQQVENEKIMRENKELLKKIRKVSSQYTAADFINNWKYLKARLDIGKRRKQEFKGTFTKPGVKKDYCMLRDPQLFYSLNPSIRKRCFFEIKDLQNEQILGTIVIELYTDIVPRTCENFEAFCEGYNGLSYRNTPIHRIVPGYWCQGGDVTKFNGVGGTSIYGDSFSDENFSLRHSGPGVLSMYKSDDTQEYNSKFNLTFKTLQSMDGKRTVFGKVVSNLAVLYKIEECGTKSGKPIRSLVISNCGVVSSKNDNQK